MNDIYIFAACRDVKSDSATNATWFQTFPPYGRYPVGGTIKGAPADAEAIIDSYQKTRRCCQPCEESPVVS